jgi:hypothetical protein
VSWRGGNRRGEGQGKLVRKKKKVLAVLSNDKLGI